MRTSTWAIVGVLVFISNPCVVAQNLLANGDFDIEISGWTPLGAGLSAEWHPSDHASNPSSGSLLTTNTTPIAANLAVVSCVEAIPDGRSYRYSGWIRVPSGQTASGHGKLWWYWYDSPSCTGTQLLAGSTDPVVSADDWVFISTDWEVAPAGTMSTWLVLGNYKTSSVPGTFQAYYDGLEFREFSIFANGFESGNTDAWSSAVGLPTVYVNW